MTTGPGTFLVIAREVVTMEVHHFEAGLRSSERGSRPLHIKQTARPPARPRPNLLQVLHRGQELRVPSLVPQVVEPLCQDCYAI